MRDYVLLYRCSMAREYTRWTSFGAPSRMHGTDYTPSGHRPALLRFPEHILSQRAIYRIYARQDPFGI